MTALLHEQAVQAHVPQFLIGKGATLTPQQINEQREENGKKTENFFHKVVWQKNIDAVRILLDLGADANLPTTSGQTPLEFALLENSVPLAKLLIEYGAKLTPEKITASHLGLKSTLF